MTNIDTTTVIVPSWERIRNSACYTVALSGATEKINGSTHIKKNMAPAHNEDYDVKCDSRGVLSGEIPLVKATKVYIWGYGFAINGDFFDCEADYRKAVEFDITNDTEIILFGANIEP